MQDVMKSGRGERTSGTQKRGAVGGEGTVHTQTQKKQTFRLRMYKTHFGGLWVGSGDKFLYETKTETGGGSLKGWNL